MRDIQRRKPGPLHDAPQVVAQAQAKLETCRAQHDRNAGNLEGSLASLRGDKFSDEQKKLDEVMNELADVAKEQDDIAAEANRIFEEYAVKADEVAKDHRREASKKVGALVEVDCETDFVARTEEFQAFAREVAVHVAASNPQFIAKEDVDEEAREAELRVLREQAAGTGKPENVQEKIVEGKLGSFYSQIVLVDQPSVRDPSIIISQMIAQASAKTGENITVGRFARFKIGELAD